MIELGLSDMTMALLGLALIIGMFVLFVSERYPAEVVAIFGAALMLVFGMLPYDAALVVLSNPAPWTIIAMFLIMGGAGAHRGARMADPAGRDARPSRPR